MSGICGWTRRDPENEGASERIAAMATALATHTDTQTALASASRGAVAAVGLGAPHDACRDGDDLAVLHGVWRWTDTELARLAHQHGAARALLQGYRERGRKVLDSLSGMFALAVLADGGGRTLLATDRTGSCPLLYCVSRETLLFASSGSALQAHPDARASMDPQGVFEYVYFGFIPAPDTARRGHERLLPGEFLESREGTLERDLYWRPRYVEDHRTPLPDREREFHELLRAGVRRMAEGAEVGAFLSGGTDSSTLAGILGEVTGCRARTYSIGFDVEGYDEMEYARCAARHFATDHHEYYVTPADVAQVLPEIARSYDTPFGNESAVAAYFCAKLAKADGVTRMLGGDGGDELFGGNSRYGTQKLFSYYERIPAFVRRGLLEPLLRVFPLGDRIPPVRKARSYVRQASMSAPERSVQYHHVERLGAAQIFRPDFLELVDTARPLSLLRDAHESALATSMLNRILASEIRFTLADNDLPKVGRMCERAGVEVAYPLLDDELLEFAARLPADLKLRGLKLRWFFKHALRDYLPRKILRKKKHGFGLPFGIWLATQKPLIDLAEDGLAGLRMRGIIQPDFLDRLVRLHRDEHATWYGVQIWSFLVLELWLRAQEEPTPVVWKGGRPAGCPA